MKNKTYLHAIALALFGVLLTTLPLSAQELSQQSKNKHHQYQLVDLGTLGGPNSYPPGSFFEGNATQSLSAAGTFAGESETAIPDPFPEVCFNVDCIVGHAVQWRGGSLTDLGTLPGTGDFSSAPSWISSNGLIAGVSENGEIDPTLPGFPELHAVLWKHHKITDLGTLEGGYESVAASVNSRGQVVGLADNGIPDDYSIVGLPTQSRAFLWQKGTMQDLGTLPGGTDAIGLLVNERGQIVGQSYTGDSVATPMSGTCGDFPLTPHGFFWNNGKMVDLGTLGGSCTFTYALNNRGQVVGQSTLPGDPTSHPYIWDRKGMKDLGTLGGTYGYATWLNDSGAVVGLATLQGDRALIAFLWKHGAISNLGALSGNGCSGADAINSQGQIVGGSGFYSADFFSDCNDPVEHAVLWENGTILDLNNFVPPGYDLTLNEATSINDRGEISGFGTISDGSQHAFLLVPCDPNDSTCQGVAADPMFRSSPEMTKPANNQNNPIRRMPRRRLGAMKKVRVANTSSAPNALGSNIDAPSEEPASAKTPLPLLELMDEGIRFSTTSSCVLRGRPCSPYGVSPRCCGTLSCQFNGGSTRVGYVCK